MFSKIVSSQILLPSRYTSKLLPCFSLAQGFLGVALSCPRRQIIASFDSSISVRHCKACNIYLLLAGCLLSAPDMWSGLSINH